MIKKFKRTLLDEIRYYGFYVWYNWLSDRPRKIKSFFQRGFRGWADEDTWGFDLYLAKIISQGLKHLKKCQLGCPKDICNKYDNRKDLTQKQKDKLMIKEWKIKLDMIIRGFEIVPKLFEEKKYIKKEGYIYEFERGVDMFKKYFLDLWD